MKGGANYHLRSQGGEFKGETRPQNRPNSAKDPIALGGMVKEWLPKAICCFANLGKGKEHQS